MRNEEELERFLRTSFVIKVSEEHVEDAFPHIERPSLKEMEIAVTQSLENKPIPMNIEVKLNRKPTKEMLDEFCAERGLYWEKDSINKAYIFRIKKFYSGA